ncbi:centrosomal protein of 68 kDa [Rhinoraja longicauda]
MSSHSVTSTSQGDMQEGKQCFTAPAGSLAWLPVPRDSADGTDTPASDTGWTFSPPPAPRGHCPAAARLDGTVARRNSLPTAAGISIQSEWPSRQCSLSNTRRCPGMDPPSSISLKLSPHTDPPSTLSLKLSPHTDPPSTLSLKLSPHTDPPSSLSLKLSPHTDPPSSLSLLLSERKPSRDVKLCGPTDWGTESRAHRLPCFSEYWACRVPDYFKPVRDRSLPGWDPDEEYQALLDFTYPLRPFSFTSREVLGGEELCSDLSGVLDSSMPADHTLTGQSRLSSPTEPGGSSSELADQSWLLTKLAVPTPHLSSSPLPAESRCGWRRGEEPRTRLSDSPMTNTITSDCTLGDSVTDSGFLSKDSSQEFSQRPLTGDVSRSTAPVPAIATDGDSDQEFLYLPHRLGQLDQLAWQLHGLSARLDEPGPQTVRLRGGGVGEAADQRPLPHRTTSDHGQLHHWHGTHSANIQRCLDTDHTIAELRKATDFIRKLGQTRSDPGLHPPQLNHQRRNSDGLLTHIQEFSGKLEEMVEWLYSVAETMDNWVAPLPDMGSIKSSLDVCAAFKNDVNEHQELTDSVLKSGEILLKSVVDTTPVLKETLELIARQSKRLNGHAAHLHSSILTAMSMVKDDLETKQHELEAAGEERQLSLAEDWKWH